MRTGVLATAMVFGLVGITVAAPPSTAPDVTGLKRIAEEAAQKATAAAEAAARTFDSSERGRSLAAAVADADRLRDAVKTSGTPQQKLDAGKAASEAKQKLATAKASAVAADPSVIASARTAADAARMFQTAAGEAATHQADAKRKKDADELAAKEADPIFQAIKAKKIVKGMTIEQADSVTTRPGTLVRESDDGVKTMKWDFEDPNDHTVVGPEGIIHAAHIDHSVIGVVKDGKIVSFTVFGGS